jgi:hypothetical protein
MLRLSLAMVVNKKMYMRKIRAALMGIALTLPCSGFSAFIVNGDFEAGNTGFSSDYGFSTDLANGGEGGGAGLYGVGTNPQNFHGSFISAGDHTTGSGNMMVVNGSDTAGMTVWSGTVAPPLSVGTTYEFSAWVMNVYPSSPANLQFSFGGNVLGTFSTSLSGWQEFTATFVATTDQSSGSIDLNVEAFGNDFALDDISLTAVPEPTTMIAGALLLLPFAASTLRVVRKNRTA